MEPSGTCEDGRICTVVRGGANIVHAKPIFSHESKYLLCATGNVIKVWSVASGECIHELHGHTDRITSIILHPDNSRQLLSCSRDKTVIKWTYGDGILVRQYVVGYPLHAMYASEREGGGLLAVRQISEKGYDLIRFSLPKELDAKIEVVSVVPQVSRNPDHTGVGMQGEFVATVFNSLLVIQSLKSSKMRRNPLKTHEVTCLTCHPSEACVATGTRTGKIFLWWNVTSWAKQLVKTCIHWHSLAVLSLAYTSQGATLLSGGHECVLVKWQHNTQHREYMPRLGSPIVKVTVSPDNLVCATSHMDNGIQVISNTNKVLQSFQGLTAGWCVDSQKTKPSCPVGLLVDPRSHALVLNGRPGHLQFYNIHTDKQLYNLDIVQQNYISPENLDKPLAVTEVEQAAFSSSGHWLITMECWDDHKMTPEMRLKFWSYDAKKQEYMLNTSVDSPHQGSVHSLKFRPTLGENDTEIAVTTSSDGNFKLWCLVDDTDIYRANQCWSCDSVGFYRDLPASCADFSADGSLLAIVFQSFLTIWDPDTNSLKTTLPHNTSITHVSFGRKKAGHLLITATKNRVYAWNLLTCTVHWSLDLEATVLVQHPNADYVAIFSQKHELIVLRACDAVRVVTKALPPSAVQHAVFVTAAPGELPACLQWQGNARLFFYTANQELLTLAGDEEQERWLAASRPGPPATEQDLPQTAIGQMMATDKRRLGARGLREPGGALTGLRRDQPHSQFVDDMLITPSYVLPPMSSLCMTFQDSLLLHKKEKRKSSGGLVCEEDSDQDTANHSGSSADSDSDMEVDASSHSITNPEDDDEDEEEEKVRRKDKKEKNRKNKLTASHDTDIAKGAQSQNNPGDYDGIMPEIFSWIS